MDHIDVFLKQQLKGKRKRQFPFTPKLPESVVLNWSAVTAIIAK